jgi:hypothetical protein
VNVELINQQIAQIVAEKMDPEVAHSREDLLRGQVLEAIAAGADNPTELAAAVLKTDQIDFPRWCA